MNFPERIICLSDETTEVLYLLGEQDRIAGISGFSQRPKQARKEKPIVSTFTSAKLNSILDLRPDLVLGFSNSQAAIAQELIAAGVTVLISNQRSIEQIFSMILMLSRIVHAEQRGRELVEQLRTNLNRIAESARRFAARPRVFFEEWMDPIIGGIRWVEELVEAAGGQTVFPDLRQHHSAKQRVIDPAAVIAANPDVILASWCGRQVNVAQICSRPGWDAITAVQQGHVYEIQSSTILQPGPAALSEGVSRIHEILAKQAMV
jgi:iron complex transport system substrate-binding protein